jgi:hypothetical protein
MKTDQLFQQLSVESQVLFLLCKTELSTAEKAQIIAKTSTLFDWKRFVALAVRTHLAAFAASSLRKIPEIILDEKTKQALKAYQFKIIAINAQLYHEFDLLATTCAKEGVSIAPLKGIYLAEELYADTALRQLSDIDVLFAPNDKEQFLTIAEQLGWRIKTHQYKSAIHEKHQSFHAPYQGYKSNLTLDIHNKLMPELFTFRMPMEEIIPRCKTVPFRSATILALDPIDLVIYTALHAYKHLFFGELKVSSLVDVFLLIEHHSANLSNNKFLKRCETFNATKEVLTILSCVRAILPATNNTFLENLPITATEALIERVLFHVIEGTKISVSDQLRINLFHRHTERFSWKQLQLNWFDLFPSKAYLDWAQGTNSYWKNWSYRNLRLFYRLKGIKKK